MGPEDLTGFREPTSIISVLRSETGVFGSSFLFYLAGYWILASGFIEFVRN